MRFALMSNAVFEADGLSEAFLLLSQHFANMGNMTAGQPNDPEQALAHGGEMIVKPYEGARPVRLYSKKKKPVKMKKRVGVSS